jgi:hypothetical protein
MPRNGSGGYSPPTSTWNPAVNGVGATAADWEALLDDMSDALTGSVAADGQTPMTAPLNMGNNRLTNVAAATARTDAVTYGQVQDGGATYLTAVSGTNTITASLTGLAAYAAGQLFRLIPANTNTGAATLNVNTLGAKAILSPLGAALNGGELIANVPVLVCYTGTDFVLLKVTTYRPPAQTASSGTTVPFTGLPAGLNSIDMTFYNLRRSDAISAIGMQVGTSSGMTTTGYSNAQQDISATVVSQTSYFPIGSTNGAVLLFNGKISLRRTTGNTWFMEHQVVGPSTGVIFWATGEVTLSGTLDRIQLLLTGGSGSFNNSSASVSISASA